MVNTVEINYNDTATEAIFNTAPTSVATDFKERATCNIRQATMEREDCITITAI